MVKNLLANVGDRRDVGSILGQGDNLEKGRAIYPSILAWRIPWAEGPGGLYSPKSCKESDMTEATEHPHMW